jgi:hypothetical protein
VVISLLPYPAPPKKATSYIITNKQILLLGNMPIILHYIFSRSEYNVKLYGILILFGCFVINMVLIQCREKYKNIQNYSLLDFGTMLLSSFDGM